ncbi:MAG: cytochrome c oxidase subunit II [Xanthomonadales bacterium]|nr:cytochrome c oxidase subunit II [Xanthomonadales bacterium]
MNFRPPQASSLAASIDQLFLAMLILSAIVVVGVFAVMLWFGIRYRHGSTANRSGEQHRHLGIESTWVLVPFVLFMGLFYWSTHIWRELRIPPADAAPVYVVAKQWMWKVQHPGGQREIDTLHVPLGQPIRLIMTSQDVIHSFYVPAFRLKQDVLPGRYTEMWFTATKEGTFDLFCAEFCGTDHSRMGGRVVVMPPAEYARWLAGHAGTDLAAQGAALFRQFGCSGCHGARSAVHAPSLENLYGSTVALSDGAQVLADDRYLHDSILLPGKEITAGYAPIMPSFAGRIGEEDVLALIEYLKSRGAEPASFRGKSEQLRQTPSGRGTLGGPTSTSADSATLNNVIPAKAGIHFAVGSVEATSKWIPAFAGMTPSFGVAPNILGPSEAEAGETWERSSPSSAPGFATAADPTAHASSPENVTHQRGASRDTRTAELGLGHSQATDSGGLLVRAGDHGSSNTDEGSHDRD